MGTRLRLVIVTVTGIALLAGCATSSGGTAVSGGRIQVVAAENFWGSIATQLAGDRAQVTSIITNPATDPHDYEATPKDARTVATAQYVIVNGIGYDAWAQKLLDADREPGRRVLDVGKLIGLKVGDNPHQWYSPSVVERVITQISSDLARLDPHDASYFAQRRHDFETKGLAPYHALDRADPAHDAGVPVGASESIVTPLVDALGLKMETPESFLDAIAEGNEPTARDTAIVTRQIDQRAIAVFVLNTQNATPDVQRLVDAARAHNIIVTTVTETLTPAGVTFQSWQVAELRRLHAALATPSP